MTPEQRRLRAKIAANARWSRPMARADQAAAARTAIYSRLEREVDPTGIIPAAERDLMVRAAARRLSATLNVAKARKRAALMREETPAKPVHQPRRSRYRLRCGEK